MFLLLFGASGKNFPLYPLSLCKLVQECQSNSCVFYQKEEDSSDELKKKSSNLIWSKPEIVKSEGSFEIIKDEKVSLIQLIAQLLQMIKR